VSARAGGVNDAVQVRDKGSSLEATGCQLSSHGDGAAMYVVLGGSATLTDCSLQVRAVGCACVRSWVFLFVCAPTVCMVLGNSAALTNCSLQVFAVGCACARS